MLALLFQGGGSSEEFIPALSLTSCVTLGKSLHLSEPPFPPLYMEIVMAPTTKVAVRIQRDHESKVLGGTQTLDVLNSDDPRLMLCCFC